MNAKIARHVDEAVGVWREVGAMPTKIHPSAVEDAKSMGSAQRTWGGDVALVTLTSDITVEAFQGRHPEVGYHDRLAGPGPALGCQLREHAFAALDTPADSVGLPAAKRREAFGPTVDLWGLVVSREHLALAVVLAWRHLCLLDADVIAAESSRVAQLLVLSDLFEAVSKCEGARTFLDGYTSLAVSISEELSARKEVPRWEHTYSSAWTSVNNRIYVARLSAPRPILVVAPGHPRRVKYHPELGKAVADQLVAGIELVQLATIALCQFKAKHGRRLQSLADFQEVRWAALHRAEEIGLSKAIEDSREATNHLSCWLGCRRSVEFGRAPSMASSYHRRGPGRGSVAPQLKEEVKIVNSASVTGTNATSTMSPSQLRDWVAVRFGEHNAQRAEERRGISKTPSLALSRPYSIWRRRLPSLAPTRRSASSASCAARDAAAPSSATRRTSFTNVLEARGPPLPPSGALTAWRRSSSPFPTKPGHTPTSSIPTSSRARGGEAGQRARGPRRCRCPCRR